MGTSASRGTSLSSSSCITRAVSALRTHSCSTMFSLMLTQCGTLTHAGHYVRSFKPARLHLDAYKVAK